MDFAYGFPSVRHARLQALRLGGEGHRLVMVFKKNGLDKQQMPWGTTINEGWEHFRGIDIERFRGGSRDLSLQFIKDSRYLEWRYYNNPSKKYRFLVFKGLFGTRGFLVYALEGQWLNILDVFTRDCKSMKDTLRALESYVAQRMRDVSGIQAWFHPDEPVVQELETLGYRRGESIPVAFKSVDADCGVDSELFYEKYYYRMGDYDAS
jgi:hypothetical protein